MVLSKKCTTPTGASRSWLNTYSAFWCCMRRVLTEWYSMWNWICGWPLTRMHDARCWYHSRQVDVATAIGNLYGRFAEAQSLTSRELGPSVDLSTKSHVVVLPKYGDTWREGRVINVLGSQVEVRFSVEVQIARVCVDTQFLNSDIPLSPRMSGSTPNS